MEFRFYFKGYGNIFVTNKKDREWVLEFLKKDVSEFGHCPKLFVQVVKELDPEKLEHALTSNGKYEPDFRSFVAAAEKAGVKFLAMSAPSMLAGDYDLYNVKYSSNQNNNQNSKSNIALKALLEEAYAAGKMNWDFETWYSKKF